MPIVTLKFTLPAEEYEYKRVMSAGEMALVLEEIYNMIRSYLKHQEVTPEASRELLEEVKTLAAHAYDLD